MEPSTHLPQEKVFAETLLERAVKRHLAMLDRSETLRPSSDLRVRTDQPKVAGGQPARR